MKELIERGPDTGNSPNLMITYNDKPGLREEVQRRWKGGCWRVFEANIDYSMASTPPYRHEQKSRRELIITNYDPFA